MLGTNAMHIVILYNTFLATQHIWRGGVAMFYLKTIRCVERFDLE